MKIVIDVMGAPENSGGMHLYARELIHAWNAEFPNDRLIVLGGEWITELSSQSTTTRVVKRQGFITRAWTQLITAGVLARRLRADRLLSVSPVVSPLIPRQRRAMVIHDWRHKLRPEEFSRAQRMYRALWSWSANHAGLAIAISPKTQAEATRFAPAAKTVVIRNGGDHPAKWTRVEPGRSSSFLTFGHHVNKRPDLVLEAYVKVRRRLPDVAPLTILGARGEAAERLRALASAHGVEDSVSLPGYVSDRDYENLIQTAECIVLASTDEGFGLPVVEANFFGIPAVVTTDNGLVDIHADLVIAATPDAASLADAMESALTQPSSSRPLPTWSDTAASIRSALIRSAR